MTHTPESPDPSMCVEANTSTMRAYIASIPAAHRATEIITQMKQTTWPSIQNNHDKTTDTQLSGETLHTQHPGIMGCPTSQPAARRVLSITYLAGSNETDSNKSKA